MDNTITSTPYDDAFKTLINDCTRLVIPVVNEIFGTSYSEHTTILFLQNEHYMNQQDANTNEKITDSCFIINENKRYHIECQSTPDGSMIVRMFEYDSQIALDNSNVANHELTVSFPESAVIYPRHNSATPDAMTIKIKTPGGHVSYQIPLLKIGQYTLEKILEKHLLLLIPFYIFVHEQDLAVYNKDKVKLDKLKNEYKKIREQLDILCETGKITEYEKCTIIDFSKMVVHHLARKYDSVKEGVENVMGGKILDHEAKDILNIGIEQGINIGEERGKKQGEIMTLVNLVKDGLLNIAEAAKRSNMDVTEFKKYL